MRRPLSWWLLYGALFWLAIGRWELNLLEVAGLAVLAGLALAFLDLVAAELAGVFREEWRRLREEEDPE